MFSENYTDVGNARRLVKLFGPILRYSEETGFWYIWDDKRFRVDTFGGIYKFAKETIRCLFKAAYDHSTHIFSEKLVNFACRSENVNRINAMVKLAQSEVQIMALAEMFDSHPMLLNVQNGTVDLENGELYPHNPKDMLTKIANAKYVKHARCDNWCKVIKSLFRDNPEIVDFMQRLMGYAITGSVREQCLIFCFGKGANGKSTILEVLMNVLGDYAMKAPASMIMQKNGNNIPCDMARMAGARFVVASELDEGQAMAESLVKDLTGGDKITARFLYKNFFEFSPSHKLIIYGNHKPEIKGVDHGIWRRIKLIPFDVTITSSQMDKNLKEKLLQERDGILGWLIEGCMKWQSEGLNEPDVIKNALHEYRNEMDVLGEFLEDCCIIHEDGAVTAGDLYRQYCIWCETNGEKPLSKKWLGTKLKQKDFKQFKCSKRGRGWHGLALKIDYANGFDSGRMAHKPVYRGN